MPLSSDCSFELEVSLSVSISIGEEGRQSSGGRCAYEDGNRA